MRLDFESFTIAGPSTSTTQIALLKNGANINTGDQDVSAATQCLTDRFVVTNAGGGINPPTICGVNTGEHSKEIK